MLWSKIFMRKRAAARPSPSSIDPFDLLVGLEFPASEIEKLSDVVSDTSRYRCSTAVLATPDKQIAVAIGYILKTVLSYTEHALHLADAAPDQRFDTMLTIVTPTLELSKYLLGMLKKHTDEAMLTKYTGYRFQPVTTASLALLRANSTILLDVVDPIAAKTLVAHKNPDTLLVLSADILLFSTRRGKQIYDALVKPHTERMDSTMGICLLSALPHASQLAIPLDACKRKYGEQAGELSPRVLAKMARFGGDVNDILF